VTAIDPVAPEGAPFRRIRLEELEEDEPFEGVVAVCSLHHVGDLPAVIEKIARLLLPGGRLVVDEFRTELLGGATARWYHGRLRRAGRSRPSFDEWLAGWRHHRDHLHPSADLLRSVEDRFVKRRLEFGPYLYRWDLPPGVKAEETELIATGAIEATGLRYVGARRTT
jgi:SAM-dependent methyltransferase